MDNEIRMKLRKDKKRKSTFSIASLCPNDKSVDRKHFQPVLFEEEDNIEDTLNFLDLKKYFSSIKNISMSDFKNHNLRPEQRDKIIFILFIIGYNQQAIADLLGFSQSYISRIVKRVRQDINNKIA